ncbi:MAG: MarR family transcriptional regulator [Actinobacteria bacterium]|nr:MarR family transcriptional regulator [Actinomycetota bacterium]
MTRSPISAAGADARTGRPSSRPSAAAHAGAATSTEVAERLRFVVARLQRRLRQQAMGDLTLTQLSMLSSVDRHGPLSLGDLASHERLAPPTVTKLVDKLEGLGLVERRAVASDRRVVHVAITAPGRRKLDAVRRRRSAWLTQQLDGLPPADLARIDAALDVLEHLAALDTPGGSTVRPEATAGGRP